MKAKDRVGIKKEKIARIDAKESLGKIKRKQA